ncbi:20s proteasome subunit beta 7 protein [Rutstroemia sp. NJR-2017a WRK4]|nr:20s proteasome subunit beta 7 protein [Rutstroemia sp. NJR-2017a WRK4]
MAGLGLVDYGSSDEEDVGQSEVPIRLSNPAATLDLPKDEPAEAPLVGPKVEPAEAPLVGPQLGPAAPNDLPEPEAMDEAENRVPLSPYSANRALLRDLTLPTIPNYDIPPSPPGSPVESTNAKFKHFLELKKQGIHFNEKLAKSAAMKNPSVMEKLMDFADINEQEQYSTTLPEDLWNPAGFPEYAYKGELAKSQQRILKKREEEKSRGQRETLDFVPATTPDETSRSGTPSAGHGGRGQQSAAERIMAGLDRGKSHSPHTQGVKRKTRFES